MQEDKTVDIDTSGPGEDVEIDTPKSEQEVTNETTTDSTESNDSIKEPVEQSDVQASETGNTEQKDASEEDGEKKKELEDYSEGVKKRIAKLTKKMREAERREHAAIEYAKTVLNEQESLRGRLSKMDTGYVSEMENRIKSSKEAAVAKLARAREDGNLELEVAAQTEISKLGYEEARLADIKSRQETRTETVGNVAPVQNNQQETVEPIDPKAQSWAQKNTWFNTDRVMKSAAIAIHEQLTEDEGYDPRSDEYYTEIDKRIRLEFPHKFGTNETQNSTREKPTQVVASASRSSKPGRKTVRLTPSQVAIAKKLGVPLELYAKQLITTKE
jgi:hypothetical protein